MYDSCSLEKFPLFWDVQNKIISLGPLLLFRSSWTIEGWTTRIRCLLLNHTQTPLSHDQILAFPAFLWRLRMGKT